VHVRPFRLTERWPWVLFTFDCARVWLRRALRSRLDSNSNAPVFNLGVEVGQLFSLLSFSCLSSLLPSDEIVLPPFLGLVVMTIRVLQRSGLFSWLVLRNCR
jgi:hypothetical protein